MTKQIGDWIDTALEPRGTGVVLTAEHSCMTMRGAQAKGSITTTSAHTGLIRTDQRTRSEFLALANSHG
jgi:GTP cyclohydrolase I